MNDNYTNLFEYFQKMSSEYKQTTSEQFLEIDLTNKNPDLQSFPHPFRSGHYGDGIEPKTLIELRMIKLSGTIRNKPK
jgi:hypothetical protein